MFLAPLVEQYPALTARIVDEGLAKWSLIKDGPTLSRIEYGQRVRQTMQSWVKGIGPLAQLVAPVREDGTLRSLGVRSLNGRDFAHYWYYGKEDLREIVDLPSNVPTRDPSDPSYDEWRDGVAISLGHQSAWSWRWAFRSLAAKLSRLLERHELPVSEGPLAHEVLWREALAVTGRPALY